MVLHMSWLTDLLCLNLSLKILERITHTTSDETVCPKTGGAASHGARGQAQGSECMVSRRGLGSGLVFRGEKMGPAKQSRQQSRSKLIYKVPQNLFMN